MEENGARLNRQRLASAYLLVNSLAARAIPQTQPQSQIRPRAGAIQEAVFRVLAAADRPLRAREIHEAAQELAGAPLSWNTVKDCLHKNARRPDSSIERVGHGRYRHR
jgi:HB1, ASXL, restriction endonuclease HTH domain